MKRFTQDELDLFKHHSEDELRIAIADNDETKVPASWYEKTIIEKRTWIIKRYRQDIRKVRPVDPHNSGKVAQNMRIKLLQKERQKMAELYREYGLS